jgi:hypothetical protein
VTEASTGETFPFPRAHPGQTEHRASKSTERALVFQYVVGPGQRTARLDYLDRWALRTNGAAVVEADDMAEGTGNYEFRGGSGGGGGGGGGAAVLPRPQPNPNGPHDQSPLPLEARGARLTNLELSRPGDEMAALAGAPTSLSHGGGVHLVVGSAYVLRVTSDAPVGLPACQLNSSRTQNVRALWLASLSRWCIRSAWVRVIPHRSN